jgi:hypothetical protein
MYGDIVGSLFCTLMQPDRLQYIPTVVFVYQECGEVYVGEKMRVSSARVEHTATSISPITRTHSAQCKVDFDTPSILYVSLQYTLSGERGPEVAAH